MNSLTVKTDISVTAKPNVDWGSFQFLKRKQFCFTLTYLPELIQAKELNLGIGFK